jgi:hypothetical protein
MKYYRFIFDSGSKDLMSVVDYEMGDFDLKSLWGKGKSNLPDNVKLFVKKEYLKKPDLLGNPISWFICSDRLIEIWMPKIEADVQILNAPIYEVKTKKEIEGYKIFNPIRKVEALDKEKSVFLGKIVTEFVFDKKRIPNNLHVFRPVESPKAIIVSDELVKKLIDQNINGVAFIKCKSS